MSDNGCEKTHEITGELALGVATGQERAEAVRHLEGCAGCRREIGELGDLLDALMLLAPERQPPVGFESRVVAGVTERRGPRRWRRLTAYALAAAVAAAATGIGAYLVTEQDRTVAAHFRTALERAGGRYLGVEFLHGPGGDRAGHVFVYRGDTSWAFMVPASGSGDAFRAEVLTGDGRTLDAGTIDVRQGGAGVVLPVDLAEVETIRLRPAGEGPPLEAQMPEPPAS